MKDKFYYYISFLTLMILCALPVYGNFSLVKQVWASFAYPGINWALTIDNACFMMFYISLVCGIVFLPFVMWKNRND